MLFCSEYAAIIHAQIPLFSTSIIIERENVNGPTKMQHMGEVPYCREHSPRLCLIIFSSLKNVQSTKTLDNNIGNVTKQVFWYISVALN